MDTYDLQTQSVNGPSQSEILLAKESSNRLATVLSNGSEYQFQFLLDGKPGETVTLPATAVQLLAQILAEMAEGNAVALTPVHEELSTLQAAQLLNVSQSFLQDLLENDQLPSHEVGTHRRIRVEDVLAYKEQRYAARSKTLDALAAYDQEIGLE